jgi:DNA polymerase-1
MTELPDDAIYLIDGYSYIYRAQFALAELTTSRGEPCQAVLGFGNVLVKLLREKRPHGVAVTLDSEDKRSFRHDLDPSYKQNRTAAPPELLRQFAWCADLVRALGIPVFVEPGFEADDLLATLARRLTQQGRAVVICSSDKDLGQLVRERVVLYDLAKDAISDETAVEERWGVRPAQLPDLFALIGDAIDNIPSVPCCGPKTAAALIKHFGSLDLIPDDASALVGVVRGAGNVAQSLKEHRARALISRELARTREDVAMAELAQGDLRYRGPRETELRALCAHLGLAAFPDRALRMLAPITKQQTEPPRGKQGLLFG